MKRILTSVLAGSIALAFAVPALASPGFADHPSCDGDKEKTKEDKKNPSSAEPQCDGDKEKTKEDKKNPSSAEPQCDGDKEKTKEDKKNPSRI
jgi:hypothetical protein